MTLSRRDAAGALLAGAAAALAPKAASAQAEAQASGGAGPVGAPSGAAIVSAAGPPAALAVEDEPDAQVGTLGDPFAEMVAPVTINGKGPYPFLIDTGANTSCIARQLAEQLGLKAGPPARVHSVVGVQLRPCVVIDHLQVGERNRRSVRAPSLPIKGRAFGGVLGIDWLKGQRLVLGVEQRKLEITRSRMDVPRNGSVIVPARQRWGQLTIVDADIYGKPIQALIDSGSQIAMCNSTLRKLVAKMDSAQATIRPENMVRLESIMGEPFLGEMIYLPFMRLGGLNLGNVPVVCADAHVFEVWGVQDKPAVVLGMDLISQFRSVTLDFGRAHVRFDI